MICLVSYLSDCGTECTERLLTAVYIDLCLYAQENVPYL